MTGQGKTYDMTIRAFNESDVRSGANYAYVEESDSKQVVVISLFPKSKWDLRTSFSVRKVTSSTLVQCML